MNKIERQADTLYRLLHSSLSLEALHAGIMDLFHPEQSPSLHNGMMVALAEVMCLDVGLNEGRLGKFAKALLYSGCTPPEIAEWYKLVPDSLWGRDWRSRKGTAYPTEKDIASTLMYFRRQAESGQAAGRIVIE